MKEVPVLLLGHGHALEDENDGAARGTDVDGLVAGIEHQYGRGHRLVGMVLRHRDRMRDMALPGHESTHTWAAKACGRTSSSEFTVTRAASGLSTRATVATKTLLAPARRNTRAHSEAVVPVVMTS